MPSLRNLSPLRAFRDLRAYLAGRKRHEIVFLFAAIAVTWGAIYAIGAGTREHTVYKPTLIYVEQWSANRTDAEIRAQQAIDGPKELARKREIERQEAARRAQYKKVDEKLKSWGI